MAGRYVMAFRYSESYARHLQTGAISAGDVVNVPTSLLDDAWVLDVGITTPTVVVGTVVRVRGDAGSGAAEVRVDGYPHLLTLGLDRPCLARFVRPPALRRYFAVFLVFSPAVSRIAQFIFHIGRMMLSAGRLF